MLGILCGLESEAKIARQVPGALVACAAARPGKARELAKGLVAQGATKLMSFGIAGALESSVRLGDIFIGARVQSKSGSWECDKTWGDALVAKIPQAKRGGVFGSEFLVATVADKKAHFRESGCLIVDMESQCLAEIAAQSNLPLVVVRAVCDDANMHVPPIVMASIAEDGSIDVAKALKHMACRPADLVDLWHVLRGTGKALSALKSAKSALA